MERNHCWQGDKQDFLMDFFCLTWDPRSWRVPVNPACGWHLLTLLENRQTRGMWFCWCPRLCGAVQHQPLSALGVKVRLGAIPNLPRGRVCQPVCGDWRKLFFYLKHDSSQEQKNPGWAPVIPEQSRGAELTRCMSLACCWLFAIPLCLSPGSRCNSQGAPGHPLACPTAEQQMSWCLWKPKPEMVEAEELKKERNKQKTQTEVVKVKSYILKRPKIF